MRQLKVYRSGVGSSQKYRSGHPDGDRYFHFRALYQRSRHKEDVVLHQERKAGEKLLDWAGTTASPASKHGRAV